jgi:hypothetical protein
MLYILDKDGDIVSKSKNLRGIREYVSDNIIKILDISEIGISEGLLSIYFESGNSYQANFASFEVLKNFVRNWRNTYGARLLVNGIVSGKIEYNNPNLQ